MFSLEKINCTTSY